MAVYVTVAGKPPPGSCSWKAMYHDPVDGIWIWLVVNEVAYGYDHVVDE